MYDTDGNWLTTALFTVKALVAARLPYPPVSVSVGVMLISTSELFVLPRLALLFQA